MVKVALLLAPLTVPGVLFKLWFVFPNNKARGSYVKSSTSHPSIP